MTSLISHLFVVVLSPIAKGGYCQDICESTIRTYLTILYNWLIL